MRVTTIGHKLISHFASGSGCRSFQTLARSSFRKFVIHHLGTPSIIKTWARLRYKMFQKFDLCYVTLLLCNAITK